MKHNIVLIFTIAILVFSCSRDNDDDENDGVNAIVGTWVATELQIDEDTVSDDVNFGKLVLDFLSENNCTVLTFTFNDDLTLIAENSANFIDPASIVNNEFICPSETETTNSTYTYDGAILTTVNDGETVTVNVTVSGDVLTADATDLDIPNFNGGGNLIFMRQ